MDSSRLSVNIQKLAGVGPSRAKLLARLGIKTVADLLFFYPRRWEDRSNIQPIAELTPGSQVTVCGQVVGCEENRPRRGLTITKFAVGDGSGKVWLVFFNQPFLKNQLRRGRAVLATGKVENRAGQLQIANPEWETITDESTLHSGRIVPIYPGTEGLSSRWLRRLIFVALKQWAVQIPEILPVEIRKRYCLLPKAIAVQELHFPRGKKELVVARRTLAFEELFLLQLGLLRGRQQDEVAGICFAPDGDLVASFLSALPFSLTSAQQAAMAEIRRDMEACKNMNRLLQGDVGSGKTVVAAYGLVKAIDNGYQGVLMAPTEILAEQHFLNLTHLLKPLGLRIALLTGSIPVKKKKEILEQVAKGEIQLVIGTHAVIQAEVEFAKLGLAVIDEQHRFGVNQRAQLVDKGINCDLLVMTATPIPRTLAMVFYADFDVTVLAQLPPGRQPVKTYWVSAKARSKVYQFLRQEIKKGYQAYWVCPLVEESDKLSVQAAVELATTLQTKIFSDFKIGLLHGRLPITEKEKIMEDFHRQKIDILVATTVIEVGVDEPNATVIVIENAERFGLAQLHQLRGRVGRGATQSYCILIGSPSTIQGQNRLKVMTQTTDGFRLAEEDLKLRGPGEFFGTRQSGLPELKVADLVNDLALLQLAQKEARALLTEDPSLLAPQHKSLKQELGYIFGVSWQERWA
jgi:ATP-dependent DNA helicase RecG